MRNPASSRAKTFVIWLTLSSGLGDALRTCQSCERCYFQYTHPWDCATSTLVARGYAPVLAARRPCGCQRNAVQNVLVRHTLTLAPPLYASRLRDRRDRPWIACSKSLASCAVDTRTSVHMLVHTRPGTSLKTFRRPCIPRLCSYFRHISSTIASSIHPFHFRYYPISGLRDSLLSWYTISGHCHIEVWTIHQKPLGTHHPQIITATRTYISILVV